MIELCRKCPGGGKTHEVKAMPEPRLIERVADSLDEAQGETSPFLKEA